MMLPGMPQLLRLPLLLLSQAHQILIMLMFYIFYGSISLRACNRAGSVAGSEAAGNWQLARGAGCRGMGKGAPAEIKALLIIFNRLYTYTWRECLRVGGNAINLAPHGVQHRCMHSVPYSAALIRITAFLRYYLSHSHTHTHSYILLALLIWFSCFLLLLFLCTPKSDIFICRWQFLLLLGKTAE